jgi:flagellar hook-length control protein FliK
MAAWQASPVRATATPLPAVAFAPLPANAPAAPARAPESGAARAHPFAELLRQSRDDGAASLAPDEHSVPTAPADNGNSGVEAAEPASTAPPTTKVRPRYAPAPAPKAGSREQVADAADAAEHANGNANGERDRAGAADDRNTHGVAAPGDGSTAAPIAADGTVRSTTERVDSSLQNDIARPLAADADEAAASAAATTAATSAVSTASRSQVHAGGRSDASDARLSAHAGVVGADADPGASTPALVAALAEATRAADAVPHRSGSEARVEAFATMLGASPSGPTGEVRAATAPTELALPTPIDSPDFGAAFGVQVSVLAKDGVHQAELHLNPAETGPVSIQIAVAGSEARIDFGADLAATRAAIEKSLPELAAALRDAGLTLTGGGVSQHAGERAPSGGDEGSPSSRAGTRSAAASGEAPVLRTVHRVAAGGVDLYA